MSIITLPPVQKEHPPHIVAEMDARQQSIERGDRALKKLDSFAPSNALERSARDQMRQENLAYRQSNERKLAEMRDRYISNYRIPHDSESAADIDIYRITDSPPSSPKPAQLPESKPAESGPSESRRSSEDGMLEIKEGLNRDSVFDMSASAESFYEADSTMKSAASPDSITPTKNLTGEFSAIDIRAGAKSNKDSVDAFLKALESTDYIIASGHELRRSDGTPFDPPVHLPRIIDVLFDGRKSVKELFDSGDDQSRTIENIVEIFAKTDSLPTNTRAWNAMTSNASSRKRPGGIRTTPANTNKRPPITPRLTHRQLARQMSNVFANYGPK